MEKTVTITDFGAVADGQTLCTQALQNAIDFLSQNGGGKVICPAGEFVLGTVFLKDNITLQLDDGCRLLGSLEFNDYQPDEPVDYPLYQDASHSFFHCSMLVAENCKNIAILGHGEIDMRSVWDEENVRNMVRRGAKTIALKCCKQVKIEDISVYNSTDLAIYFAGCEEVEIARIKMRVYIDGISPDNCKNVVIRDCDIETGDDGIVFKSSYTLNRLGKCENIKVTNCRIKSRCNAFKFGTETNGGFENIEADGLEIYETRISGIAIETVDGAIIDGIKIRNVQMKNVYAPFYLTVGDRMRGPAGRKIGSISNVSLENIKICGPYEPYSVTAWNYGSFKKFGATSIQEPWKVGQNADKMTREDVWQTTSNICGHKENPIRNLVMRNIEMELNGGAVKDEDYEKVVYEGKTEYPEVYALGKALPAKGIYFRRVEGLTLDNVTVKTVRPDVREDFVFEYVTKTI